MCIGYSCWYRVTFKCSLNANPISSSSISKVFLSSNFTLYIRTISSSLDFRTTVNLIYSPWGGAYLLFMRILDWRGLGWFIVVLFRHFVIFFTDPMICHSSPFFNSSPSSQGGVVTLLHRVSGRLSVGGEDRLGLLLLYRFVGPLFIWHWGWRISSFLAILEFASIRTLDTASSVYGCRCVGFGLRLLLLLLRSVSVVASAPVEGAHIVPHIG